MMHVSDIAMGILSHHPVQLLATAVLLVQLARAVFWGPTAQGTRLRVGAPRARGFDGRARRLLTQLATGHAERLAKSIGR